MDRSTLQSRFRAAADRREWRRDRRFRKKTQCADRDHSLVLGHVFPIVVFARDPERVAH
jgi:hypothetical protein